MDNTDVSSRSANRQSVPLYQQVEQYLLTQIESGELRPGEMLPSVKSLCEQFGGINHLTVRQAITNLAERKLVQPMKGRGTFVCEPSAAVDRIALVLPDVGSTLAGSIARGAQQVLKQAGIKTLILNSQSDSQHEIDNVHHLKELPLKGAIIFPTPQTLIAEEIIRLWMNEFPFVLVDRSLRDVQCPTVVVDNHGGSYRMTEYLVKKGYKRMAWVGEMEPTSAQNRFSGFRDALNDNGLTCPRSWVCTVDSEDSRKAATPKELETGQSVLAYYYSVAHRTVLDWMQREVRPDAIVCSNDAYALECLHVLRECNVNVPEEIAVVGFDDLPEAARSNPPLTTIRQPMQQIGEEAARMLIQHLKDPETPTKTSVLPVELIHRRSA